MTTHFPCFLLATAILAVGLQDSGAADLGARFFRAQTDSTPAAQREDRPGLFKRLFGSRRAERRSDAREDLRRSRSTRPSSRSTTTQRAEPARPSGTVHHHHMARATRDNTRVVVDISKQRAYLLVGGDIAISTPVSTARPGKYTPRGTYYMGERVRSGKISTIYNVSMPYWMRLGNTVFGVHAGYLPGYPASAGCIRLPYDMAQLIYDHTRSGTKVSIYSSWSGA